MTTDFPSDWHIQEAINRTGVPDTLTPEMIKKAPAFYSPVLAHARTLAEFLPEPEPVDPDTGAVKRIIEAWGGIWAGGSLQDDAAAIAQYKAEIANLRPVQDTRTDLEIAREAAAKALTEDGIHNAAANVANGHLDNTAAVRAALIAVRMARGDS